MSAHIFGRYNFDELKTESERIFHFINRNHPIIKAPVIEGREELDWTLRTVVDEPDADPFFEFSEDPVIYLQRQTKAEWRKYCSKDQHIAMLEYANVTSKFLDGKINFHRTIGLFLPWHEMLVDLRDPFSRNLFKQNDDFKRLGYKKVKKYFSDEDDWYANLSYPIWEESFGFRRFDFSCLDNLYLLRKRKSFRAFDKRAEEIVRNLITNIPNGEDGVYNFALYQINITKEADSYLQEDEEIELGLKRIVQINGNEILNGRLEDLCNDLPPSWALGIKSNIQFGRKKYHIPMIDFIDGFKLQDEWSLRTMNELKTLDMDGIFVRTENSSHFYGFRLLTYNEWQHYMAALNRLESSDKKFVEIQRKSHSTLLRLTPCIVKPNQPELVGFFRNGNYAKIEIPRNNFYDFRLKNNPQLELGFT